jgi:hypothetical protein
LGIGTRQCDLKDNPRKHILAAPPYFLALALALILDLGLFFFYEGGGGGVQQAR